MTFVNTFDLILVFASEKYRFLYLWSIFPTRFYGNL